MTNEMLKKLFCELLCAEDAQNSKEQHKPINNESYIVVMTNGFVYQGQTTINNSFVEIKNSKNIRIWGTTKGLGELINGPLPTTKVDNTGEIIAPLHAVIHFIKCNSGW